MLSSGAVLGIFLGALGLMMIAVFCYIYRENTDYKSVKQEIEDLNIQVENVSIAHGKLLEQLKGLTEKLSLNQDTVSELKGQLDQTKKDPKEPIQVKIVDMVRFKVDRPPTPQPPKLPKPRLKK